MAKGIVYHNDGSIRMDYFAFRSLPATKIVAALRERATVKTPHVLRPASAGDGVKEFL